jgi:hypothetical protein
MIPKGLNYSTIYFRFMSDLEDSDEYSRETEAIVKTLKELPVNDNSYSLKKYSINQVENIINFIPGDIKSVIEGLDPTGKFSLLFSKIGERKSERDRERIYYALAWIIQRTRMFNRIINPENEQDIDLMMMYLERCRETYQLSKIRIFSNIWINGLIHRERCLEEKAYIFNLASLLTLEELYVLQFIHKQQGYVIPSGDVLEGVKLKNPSASTQKIADAFGITKEYATQLCIRLQGMGLLYPADITFANISGSAPPQNFAITEYVDTFIKYILEPDME